MREALERNEAADAGIVGTVGLTAEDAARIGAALEASKASSTRRVYASAWRAWEAWCAGRGVPSSPATPVAIAAYLAERAEAGASVSTLDLAVAAIRSQHLDLGVVDPTVDVGLARVRRGLRRTVGVAPRRTSHPITVRELRRMVTRLDRSTPTDARDAALLLVGYASALRRSELAKLTTTNLEWRPNGLLLTIERSKGDQDGRGQVVAVARGQHLETDPVSALHRWLALRGRTDGPLFTQIRRGGHVTETGLSGAAIAQVIRSRSVEAGLGDLRVSGHSLRSGHATAAAEAGVGVDRIAAQTRHKRIDTLIEHYVRPAELLATTSSAGIGL